MDSQDGEVSPHGARRPPVPRYWGDRLAWGCVLDFCIVGWVLLGLDTLSYLRTGRFEVAAPAGMQLAWPLLGAGALASALAVASRPTSNRLFAAAILLEAVFAAGALVCLAVCLPT